MRGGSEGFIVIVKDGLREEEENAKESRIGGCGDEEIRVFSEV